MPFLLMLGLFVLLHVPALRVWPGGARPTDKAAGAMGLAMILPGVMHFSNPARFTAMIPPFLPAPELLVFVSGVAELALAAGLLVPATRRWAGWFGVALFVAIWSANIYVAFSGSYPEGFSQSPVYHAFRVPFQLLYVGWAAWAALGHLPGLNFRRRMMAKMYDKVTADYEEWIAPRKKELFRGLSGSVLEIGPGTGANFPYYDKSIRWIGLEPNEHMHAALRAKAKEHGIEAAEFRTVGAEGMDVPDASVDAVVCTLVLCSVPDPDAVLADVRRVLKPGGRFYVIEHVAAEPRSWRRRKQRIMRPVWQCFADGCTTDRDTASSLRNAGFSAVDLEAFETPQPVVPSWVAPHVMGICTR